MAKFYGPIGYVKTEETEPGIWKSVIEEKKYYGDSSQDYRHLQNGQKVNSDISINVRLAIVADPYLFDHFYNIRYVKYFGTYWEVSSIEPQYPKLIINLGGIYNGETAEQ